jgi:hypothetical protein
MDCDPSWLRLQATKPNTERSTLECCEIQQPLWSVGLLLAAGRRRRGLKLVPETRHARQILSCMYDPIQCYSMLTLQGAWGDQLREREASLPRCEGGSCALPDTADPILIRWKRRCGNCDGISHVDLSEQRIVKMRPAGPSLHERPVCGQRRHQS